MKPNIRFFLKINKIDESLGRMTKTKNKERKKTPHQSQEDRREITANLQKLHRWTTIINFMPTN